jgi:pyridoxamine 5'-phosphate oxidase
MSIDIDIRNLRRDYNRTVLNESILLDNPMDLFKNWLEEAVDNELKEPNAMVLSTVYNNKPKARVVLLKQVINDKLLFFTNYNSNKGKEIELNPNVTLTFFWEELQRQVRIEGIAIKSSEEISDEYFSMRGKESQIAAWTSLQSQEITKEDLDKRLEFFKEKYKNIPVDRPPHWGAYEIYPETIEFWQGGNNRLHHRFIYERTGNFWIKKRLAP